MDAVAFLEEFVRIPSPSCHEGAAAAYLVAQMTALGFDAHIDAAGNAVGSAGTAGPLVVLLGHIDTVTGAVPVRIEEGRLYGRGAVDAKGAFATFVQAAARALQQGSLNCRVVLVGAVEEETAASRGAHFVVDKYTPDYCVIGEPSGWDRVTLGYKGRLLAHYRRDQPAGHSAGEARAAAEHMVDFWAMVQRRCHEHNQQHERLFDQLLPALQRVASGSDGLYDWAEATVGLRLPESISPHHLAEELRQQAVQMAAAAATGVTNVTFEGACPAFRSPRTTPLAGAFVRAIRAGEGKPGFVLKTGTADMNVVGPAWKCPTLAYGPGDSRLDHSPDEHLLLDEYQRAINVLSHVLASLR
jgi:LysW-gamma-L-lysine carboxypeptidase